MEWRSGGTRGVECMKWFSAGSGCMDRVGRGSGSGKRQWQWEVAVAVGRGSGNGSRKWDASGIVPEVGAITCEKGI